MEGCRATDGNTANPYIICVCVCVRAMIIVENFVLFTTSVISLQYEFTLKYVKLCNNNNNNNNNNEFQIT